MVWEPMSSGGVGPLCFIKTTVSAAVYQEVLDHFMFPLTSILEMDFSFSSGTWHLFTLPKVPIPVLITIISLCLICQQNCLTLSP
ncbi:hypothetical protein GDO81_006128 [Engystomops pustulosus]|uniref:Uncharacterized protein n=1 Tax=Engystomops pustulosus TaxID=76066 RepID=A0AAV7CUV0_ENGPU|nr:hypothetical protein GDO81_006128 [Engystomops pustulosus]